MRCGAPTGRDGTACRRPLTAGRCPFHGTTATIVTSTRTLQDGAAVAVSDPFVASSHVVEVVADPDDDDWCGMPLHNVRSGDSVMAVAVSDSTVCVITVDVPEHEQRQGIATALLDHAAATWPGRELVTTDQTADGRAFFAAWQQRRGVTVEEAEMIALLSGAYA